MKTLRKKFQDKLAEANSVAEETISNMRTVRSFSNERKRGVLYDKDIDFTYGIGKKLAIASGKCFAATTTTTTSSWGYK